MALLIENDSGRMIIIKSMVSAIYMITSHCTDLEEESIIEGFHTARQLFLQKDINAFATLSCIILESSQKAHCIANNDYWDMIHSCLDSKSILLRKRGAYMFQKLLTNFEPTLKSSSSIDSSKSRWGCFSRLSSCCSRCTRRRISR